MIKILSSMISQYFGKNNHALTKKDILKIQYTLEVILGDLTKFIILFSLFMILNEIPFFLLSFIILVSTRPLGGGIHCKTFNSCLMLSMLYFLAVLMFSKLSPTLSINLSIFLFLLSFVIILVFAPCHNEKRPITNKATLKILSLISLTFWGGLFFNLSNLQVCNCIFISIFLQIFQLIFINMKGGVVSAKIYKLFFSNSS